MLNGLYIAFIGIFSCGLTSYYIAPFIKNLGFRFNIFDIPNSRKIHTKPLIRIGGLSFCLTFIFFIILAKIYFHQEFVDFKFINQMNLILIGSILSFLIGLHDDIFKSSAFLRLTLQFILALIITFNGLGFPDFNFYLPFLGEIQILLPNYISSLVGAFWIVSLINAINWLDGIDGLAAGFSLILTLGFLSLMISSGDLYATFFFCVLAGSIFGFLIRNFKPAFYIMGDCGSNFLGFILSSSSLVFLNTTTNQTIPIYYLLMIFSLPVFDMLYVILNRLLNNKSIFQADRGHIHHRLLDLNFKYKDLIFILYLYSFISIFLGLMFINK